MMTLSSFSTTTDHTPDEVFARWADPEGWPAWDPEVRDVAFAGPATVGARGTMRPRGAPPTRFAVTALEPGRVFTNASAMPGARLVFEHRVEPTPAGALVAVDVRVEGPLAGLWGRMLRRGLGDAARSSIEGLLAHLDAHAEAPARGSGRP